MNKDKEKQTLIRQVIDELGLNLTEDEVHELVSFQFKAVRHAITNKKFIKLPRLGTFMVKEGRDKYLSPDKRFYEPHLRNSSSELSQDVAKGTDRPND